MSKLTYITGNQDKINSAKEVFSRYPNIELVNKKIETPEIQSLDVKEVAEYSVKYASKELQTPVMKMDCGYYLEALNGFPGPLVKYFQNSITVDDLLKLLEGKSRMITIKECLSYCEPNSEPVSFVAEIEATMAMSPAGEGSVFDKLVIYKGFDMPQAACNYDKIVAYWNDHLDHYKRLADWLSHKQ
jgi:XTP/dITP diphosphohydrolase